MRAILPPEMARTYIRKNRRVGVIRNRDQRTRLARVRRAIGRLASDYVKIKAGGVYKVITDKSLKGSIVLTQEEVKGYLESAIPNTALECPISTSRNWRREKSTKKDHDYEAVINTWLPVKDQTQIAKDLGAIIVKHARWVSPKDADEDEWAEKFKHGIKKRERLVIWWLKHKEHGIDMQDYLNRQYIEDEINDEHGSEGIIEKYLFEEV